MKKLYIATFLIISTLSATSQIPNDSCYRSLNDNIQKNVSILLNNLDTSKIKSIDTSCICSCDNQVKEFNYACNKWKNQIKNLKTNLSTKVELNSDYKKKEWKRDIQNLLTNYNTEWIELEKFFHPDSTAIRVKDMHNNYFKRDSANNSISYIDSSFITTGIYLSGISNKSKQIKHITAKTLSRTDTIVALLHITDTSCRFIQVSFYNDGIAGIGYFQKKKSDTITKRFLTNLWIQVILPYNKSRTNNKSGFGGMIATGLMKKQFNFLAGVVYQDADVYENISWIISGHYFSNGWGIGASYSPLLKAGVHVFKSVGK